MIKDEILSRDIDTGRQKSLMGDVVSRKRVTTQIPLALYFYTFKGNDVTKIVSLER